MRQHNAKQNPLPSGMGSIKNTWRPEGFYKNLAMMPTKGKTNLVEFIADAMLESLLNSADSFAPNSLFLKDGLKSRKFKKGRFVFIPDDRE